MLATITGFNDADIFSVTSPTGTTTTTIRDLNLTTSGQPASGALLNAVTNYGDTSVGNLTIDNITTNGAVNIDVTDASINSVVSITDSTFNPAAVYGSVATPIKAISITANNSTVSIGNIDDNTITFSSSTGNLNPGESDDAYQMGINLYASGNNGLISSNSAAGIDGSISDNTITFGNNSLSMGISVGQNSSAATWNLGNINGNTISMGDIGSVGPSNNAVIGGIFLSSKSQTSASSVTSVSGNVITIGNAPPAAGDTPAALTLSQNVTFNGILIINGYNGGGTQTIGAVNNNTVTFNNDITYTLMTGAANSTNEIAGIQIYENGGTQNITSVSGNKINFNGSLDVTNNGSNNTVFWSGIDLFMYNGGMTPPAGTQTVTSGINSNTVNFNGAVTSNGGTSPGVDNNYVNGLQINGFSGNSNQTQTVSSISGNAVNFNAATSTTGNGYVSGMFFSTYGTTTSSPALSFSVTNNAVSFADAITGLSNVTGYYLYVGNNSGANMTVNAMYGNDLVVNDIVDTTDTGILLQNQNFGGTMTININDPDGSTTGGVPGLEAANNGTVVVETGNGTANITINGVTP